MELEEVAGSRATLVEDLPPLGGTRELPPTADAAVTRWIILGVATGIGEARKHVVLDTLVVWAASVAVTV